MITVTEPPREITELLDEVRQQREIDELGLNPQDIQYLEILKRENKPVGEKTLLNLLGSVDRDRVVNEIEPFLRRLGFIRYTGGGREITRQGKQYVLNKRLA